MNEIIEKLKTVLQEIRDFKTSKTLPNQRDLGNWIGNISQTIKDLENLQNQPKVEEPTPEPLPEEPSKLGSVCPNCGSSHSEIYRREFTDLERTSVTTLFKCIGCRQGFSVSIKI